MTSPQLPVPFTTPRQHDLVCRVHGPTRHGVLRALENYNLSFQSVPRAVSQWELVYLKMLPGFRFGLCQPARPTAISALESRCNLER